MQFWSPKPLSGGSGIPASKSRGVRPPRFAGQQQPHTGHARESRQGRHRLRYHGLDDIHGTPSAAPPPALRPSLRGAPHRSRNERRDGRGALRTPPPPRRRLRFAPPGGLVSACRRRRRRRRRKEGSGGPRAARAARRFLVFSSKRCDIVGGEFLQIASRVRIFSWSCAVSCVQLETMRYRNDATKGRAEKAGGGGGCSGPGPPAISCILK